MVLTYLDTNILIAAALGSREGHEAAMRILDDPSREFAASKYLELELIPKPTREKNTAELEFYNEFFDAVKTWAEPGTKTVKMAISEASRHNIKPLDALHIASAVTAGADELITAENKKSEFFRCTSIRVTPIRT